VAIVVAGAWRLWTGASGIVRVFIVGLATAMLASLAVRWWVARRSWIRRGYRIHKSGRETWVYEETSTTDGARHLAFDGEMLVGMRSVLFVPNAIAWRHSMPEWARERRPEILGRITEALRRAGWMHEETDLPPGPPTGQ
jgi:hypothetical protein